MMAHTALTGLFVLTLDMLGAQAAISVLPATKEELVANLISVGGGAIVSNIRFTGNSDCAGLFTGGQSAVPGLTPAFPNSGVVISSGNPKYLDGQDRDSMSTYFGTPGDADLNSIVNGKTQDACVLEFNFECEFGSSPDPEISLKYIFSSEEYNEWVNSYNDAFAFFLNGENIALIPGTDTPVTVDTVNLNKHSECFINNDPSDGAVQFPLLEADGFTTTLTASGHTKPGVNRMKLAIADRGDYLYDSWAIIEAGTFTCAGQPEPSVPPSSSPSRLPSSKPSLRPSRVPSSQPSLSPSSSPSQAPSSQPSSSPSFESVSHGLCASYAVHARTTITFDGRLTTIHGGDIGVSPGTSITGSYTFDHGQVVLDSSEFADLVRDAHASAMEVRVDATAMPIEIGGLTFTPGTHRSGSAINFAYGTVVTLDGLNEPNPVFLFQAGSTLVTAADTHFILKNGAKAENVYWALGTAATLGANSIVVGSILAGTAITFGTKSELRGCALAQSAVTFESDGSIQVNHYIEDDILMQIRR